MFDNTIGQVEDLPPSIREFYTDEIRDTPEGEQSYLRLIPMPETDGLDRLRLFIERGVDEHIRASATRVVAGMLWEFHEQYLTWLSLEPAAPLLAKDDAGEVLPDDPGTEIDEAWVNGVTPDIYAQQLTHWQNLEPSRPVDTVDSVLSEVKYYKLVRDTGRYAPITVAGFTYDAEPESLKNIEGAVRAWDTLVNDDELIESGLIVDGQMAWTMEDNTIQLVTKAMLEEVLSALTVRASLLHVQYMKSKQ